MQGRFKMEYRLFTIVRYNYGYYNTNTSFTKKVDGNARKKCTFFAAGGPSTSTFNIIYYYIYIYIVCFN
jgi:hypothetical protein